MKTIEPIDEASKDLEWTKKWKDFPPEVVALFDLCGVIVHSKYTMTEEEKTYMVYKQLESHKSWTLLVRCDNTLEDWQDALRQFFQSMPRDNEPTRQNPPIMG